MQKVLNFAENFSSIALVIATNQTCKCVEQNASTKTKKALDMVNN